MDEEGDKHNRDMNQETDEDVNSPQDSTSYLIPTTVEPDKNPSQGISPTPIFVTLDQDVTQEETIKTRYPVRKNRGVPKKQYQPELKSGCKYPINNYVSSYKLAKPQRTMIEELSTVVTPKNIHDALKDSRWRKVVNDEMDALQWSGRWDVVSRRQGKKMVGCRWIFTVKLNAEGTIERYKARLVAKGYTQKYGIDYGDTFALVAKINTIRILISIAANKNWLLHQFDVKNAFLNGTLEEEVYMDPPPGINCRDKVCKLKKALYGSKQSPRAWFGRFSNFMKTVGYKQSDADHTFFVKI